ncbi:hypothetical protein [Roseomonas sp. USHLN139]|uniref:hypothetical protein n=1 Tax=Roseomonas sp. USHLN139 TaxID=3081298 RepID=UPI003B025E64
MAVHLSAAPSTGMKKPSATRAAGTPRPTAAFDAAWASLDDTLERLGEGVDVLWAAIDPERRGGERLPVQNRLEFLVRALRQEHSEADGLLQQLGALADALEAQQQPSRAADQPRSASTPPRAAAAREGSRSDDSLIRLCSEHIRNMQAYDSDCGSLDPGEDPLWAAYAKTRDAVWSSKPCTLEGIIAKARVALAEAGGNDGADLPERPPVTDGAWRVVHDLLRLGGGSWMMGKHVRRADKATAAVRPDAESASTATGTMASDDAELVSLSKRLCDADAEALRLSEGFWDAVRPAVPPAIAARLEELSALDDELWSSITARRATALPGYRAKASALLTRLAPGGIPPAGDANALLAWSLCRDLLGEGAALTASPCVEEAR